jgi:hypothetical protein
VILHWRSIAEAITEADWRVAPVSGFCSNHIEGAPGPSSAAAEGPGETQKIDPEISFPQSRQVSADLSEHNSRSAPTTYASVHPNAGVCRELPPSVAH